MRTSDCHRDTGSCQKECYDAECSRPSPDEFHEHSSRNMVHLLRTSYAFGQPLLQALAASRLVNSAGLYCDVRIAESLQTCLNTVICIARPIGRDGQLTLRFASAFLRAAARRTPSPMALRHALLRFVRSVLTVSPSVFRLRYEGTAKFSDCWALSSTADLLTNREPREREAQQDYWGGSREIGDQQIAHL